MRRLCCTLLVGLLILSTTPAQAETATNASEDPVRNAIANLHEVDGTGKWFTASIAMIGAFEGIFLGSWAMYKQPLATDGKADMATFASGMALVGTGFGQLVHTAMRFDERTASAMTAKKLLDDPELLKTSGRLYLEHRASEAWSTRFWGAVITTVQGVAAGTIGTRLILDGGDEHKTHGWVIATAGVIVTGVGAIHFFGRPNAQRELDKALGVSESAHTLQLSPTLLLADDNRAVPALALSGSF